MGIRANADGFKVLSRDLSRAVPAAEAASRAATKAGAQVVLQDAKRRVSYSRRIPESGRVVPHRDGWSVVFGGSVAPDAAPIENRGVGFVRHPVFGNRAVWTAKHSHPPFLHPAVIAYRDTAPEAIGDEVTVAIRSAVGKTVSTY